MPPDRIDDNNRPETAVPDNSLTAIPTGIGDVRGAIPNVLDGNALSGLNLHLPPGVSEKLTVALAQKSPADYPPGVDPHLASHAELLDSIFPEPSELKTLLQVFIKHHDLAYSDKELNLEDEKMKAELHAVFCTDATIAGYLPDAARIKADEALAFVTKKENQHYTARKILLHGTGSIVSGMRRLQAAGLSEEEYPGLARGLSYIFAAHHPGYPIDMVRNFVQGGDVPADLCPILFICSKEAARLASLRKKKNVLKAVLTPSEEGELAILEGNEGTSDFDGSANQLRNTIINFGAEQAGIPPEEARMVGLLGYALDRITPSRRMRDIQIDKQGIVAADEKGNLQTSGEAQKKYPLIVRNFSQLEDETSENIFPATIENVKKERDAFVTAFREIDPALEELTKKLLATSDEEIAALEDIQNKALAFGKTIIGVTGHLTNMSQDLACLRSRYREMPPDHPDREACQYLIAFLQSIQGNPMSQQKLRELREAVKTPDGARPEEPKENSLIHEIESHARVLRPGSRRGTMIHCVVDYARAHPEFANRLQRRSLKEGEVILGQGQENHTVFLLLSGTGKPAVYKEVRTKEGQMQRRLIDRMAFPNVAGELSLLNDNTATADVVIEGGDVEAITMTSNDFHQLMSTEGFEEAFQSLARQRLLAYVTKTEVLSSAQGVEELANVLNENGGKIDDHKKDILEGVIAYANAHPNAENLFLRKQFNRDSRIITQSPEHRGTGTVKEKSGERSIFVVLKGRAGIYRRSESGDPIFLGIIGPGTTVGEMLHFSKDRRRNATVTAEEDGTVVLEVREEEFQAMLRENVPLAVRLEQLAKQRENQKGLKIITGLDVADNWRTKFSPDVLNDPKKRDAAIDEVNDLYPGGVPNFRECQFTIVGRSEDGVVTIDSAGRVYFEEITRESAREVLARYKVSPTQKIETAGEEDASKNRYELLRECMWRNPDIHTIDAYTYNTLPQGKDDKKAEIADIDKWIPERHAVRENIVETWRAKIVEGHEKMKRAIAEKEGLTDLRGKKVLVLLSGNTASGKSYTVEHPPAACERIGLLNIDPSCAINPDEMKAAIRGEELVNGVPQITSIQAHTEGAQMAEDLIRWALGKEMHVAIDKRFTKPSDVREVTNQAQGYHTIMIDVDAELQTSLDRVYGNPGKGIKGRNPNGTSPIPPRTIIDGGYTESVSHRREKANLIHEINGEYWLLKSDIPGEKQAVLLAQQQPDEAEPTLNTDYPMLVMHAMQAPEGMLFSRKCLANIEGMSRTIGSGIVDTSATAKKAASMAKIDGSVGDFARLNFQCVVERVHAERNRVFESPQDVRAFIETIATEINRGIVKAGVLYRTADSAKFPYTAIAKLPDAMNQFCAEFHRRLNDPDQDSVALAAWVEYTVDLTDHFFEDGCGKVAKVLSAWVLARASVRLPAYRGRGEYYAFVKDHDMLNEKAWEVYYRTFFPREGGLPNHWEGKQKEFAALIQQKHHGMRSGGRPDWQHCIDVTCDLEAALSLDQDIPDAEKETILLAGLGHDLYEDTDVDHEEIQQKFGADTDRKIAALTNPTGDTSVTAYLAQIHAADEGVKIIKLGDMLDNYRSVLQDTKQPPAKRQLPKEWFLQFFLPIIEPMYAQMQQETFIRFPKASRFLLLQIQSYRSEMLSKFPEFSLPS